MTCPYKELANKLHLHVAIKDASPGFSLSDEELDTIIEALRYTSEHQCPATDMSTINVLQSSTIPTSKDKT